MSSSHEAYTFYVGDDKWAVVGEDRKTVHDYVTQSVGSPRLWERIMCTLIGDRNYDPYSKRLYRHISNKYTIVRIPYWLSTPISVAEVDLLRAGAERGRLFEAADTIDQVRKEKFLAYCENWRDSERED